ncbi:MAG TPA: transglycosylase SLT domain-containing protein, partial [Acidobacteriaceae bacterium]
MAANNIYIQVDLNSQTAQQNVNQLNQAIAQTGPTTQKASQQATQGLAQVNVSVSQTTKAFGELTNALAGLGLAHMTQSLIQVGSEMGRAQTMLAHFTGSAEDASKIIEQIRAVASQGIFSFKDLQASAQAMAGFGLEAKTIPATLKIITDQVTAMGGSIENVNALVGLFGRITAKEFVSAGDLLKALPKQGVQVMEALRTALSAQLHRAVDIEDVRTYLKENLLKPQETIAVILKTMQEHTGGAGAAVNDAAKSLKNLGDAFDVLRQKMASDQGFGKAFQKLGEEVASAVNILGNFVKWLMDLPEPTKEMIVNIAALTAAFTALNLVLQVMGGLLGPTITVIKTLAVTLTMDLLPALVGMLPEIVAVMGVVGGLGALLAYKFPEQAKKMEESAIAWGTRMKDMATGWAASTWSAVKDTFSRLTKDSGLFGKDTKIAPITVTGDLADTNSVEALKVLQKQVDEWSIAAGKTLLGALSSPAEAVALKYKELFDKLKDMMEKKLISDPYAANFMGQLQMAQAAETEAELFKKRKQHIAEVGKLNEEGIKGSYEAQIAYIEALDEQDTRKKIASTEKITELRVKSAEDVAAAQKRSLDEVFNAEAIRIRRFFPKELADAAVLSREADLADQKKVIDQKQSNETQKYRLEGWKKANDLIIEDQKRIYESFKSEFDEIFDAFTQKGKTIGQAMGDVFKKLFLGEAKQLFSSTLAQSATELAGYGKPEVQYSRGGIISQLFQRGQIPRAPSAPPAQYVPKAFTSADILPEVPTTGANNFVIGVDAFTEATRLFALTVQQFAAAGGGVEGGGGLAALGIPAPALATGWGTAGGGGGRYGSIIQQASAASGVSPQILRAVIGQESGGNPLARSLKGAMGEMQLMPGTARDLGVTNPYDPQQNITGGARYLGQLMQRYPGDLSAALAAYNMGPAAYDRAVRRGTPLPRETQAYVPRVMQALKQLGGADVAVQVATGGAPAFSMDQLAGLPTRLTAVSAPEIALPELTGMGGGGMAPGVPAGVSGAG